MTVKTELSGTVAGAQFLLILTGKLVRSAAA